jgi:hypothetical protein
MLTKLLGAGSGILSLIGALQSAGGTGGAGGAGGTGNASWINNIYKEIGNLFDPNNTSSWNYDTGADIFDPDYFGGSSEGE